MTERERLIKLIIASVDGCSEYWAALIADYLLANGVVVPVRCENCKHHDTVSLNCEYLAATTLDQWYCWNGERRADNGN